MRSRSGATVDFVPLSEQSTAIVTGAGAEAGIGFATARRMAAAGMHVVMVATSERIHDRAAELVSAGWSAEGAICDLRDSAAVDSLVGALTGRCCIDVLVNNAGMTSRAAGADADRLLDELTVDEWDDTMRRNLTTAFSMCRAVVPGMRGRRHGRIVNVASTTGPVSAFAGASGYAAAKAGMVGMTRALAIEVASSGITVNAVAPGWIDTPSVTEWERRAGAASPTGRSGTADEVAAVVAFLASRDASYVNGAVIVVDGANHVVEDVGGAR